MKVNWLFFLSLALLPLLSTCEKEQNAGEKNIPGLTITWERASGFCISECRLEIRFSEGQVLTRQFDRPGDNTPKWTCQRPLPSTQWSDLTGSFNKNAFSGLGPSIGCPGCADEPIETIRVSDGSETLEVRFNAGTEVPQIQSFLNELREKAALYDEETNCE